MSLCRCNKKRLLVALGRTPHMKPQDIITRRQPPDRAWHAPDAAPVTGMDDISISCHAHVLPSFVERELERLYGNIYSSVIHFRTYDCLDSHTCTYVARKGDKPVAIFVFRQQGDWVHVINEGMVVDAEEITRFARHIFSTCTAVDVITFHAVRVKAGGIPFLHQRLNCSEDIVLALPSTREHYLQSLGKNTRRNIRRYMERLLRSFPSFRCDAYDGAAVPEQQLREIIGFNRERMAGKNKVSTIDEREAARIIALAKSSGLVTVATIDGRICAGGIAYRCGDNYFLYVIAHDPRYDDLWIGILCCYLTICACIDRGGKEFHFLWGRYEYKYALGAVLHNLEHLAIYRSRTQLLLHAPVALRTALDGYLHDLKFGLLERARQQDSFAFRLLNRLRKMKRMVASLKQGRRVAAKD
jgi:hypothetical protein